jgi:hypothetical protein
MRQFGTSNSTDIVRSFTNFLEAFSWLYKTQRSWKNRCARETIISSVIQMQKKEVEDCVVLCFC